MMMNSNEIMIGVTPRSSEQNYIVWHGHAYPVYFDDKDEMMSYVDGMVTKKWEEESN